MNARTPIKWPGGKGFAFTVFDDTDYSTLENVQPVYSFLRDQGFRTTKSVWPVKGSSVPLIGGETCENADYLKWARTLQMGDFEIALHNVTYHSSVRETTIRGIETFREMFGHYPYSFANHAGCSESIYWGPGRLGGVNRILYNVLTLGRRRGVFQGHEPDSPFFWGDVSRDKIKYVRNFGSGDINTLKACPPMPYHDPKRPYVNYWFASSEGPEVDSFAHMIRESNQDRLEREGGACIMYTHFANGFFSHGSLNGDFRRLIVRLSRKNGWFVPVVTLLDYILNQRGPHRLAPMERVLLETKWLIHKINTGGTS